MERPLPIFVSTATRRRRHVRPGVALALLVTCAVVARLVGLS